jgi:hypothetical protein
VGNAEGGLSSRHRRGEKTTAIRARNNRYQNQENEELIIVLHGLAGLI